MNPTPKIIGYLEKVRQAKPGHWLSCCPAHADKTPSLSVTLADDGKTLLFCHSGCPTQSIVEAAGLKLSDLFPDSKNLPAYIPQKRQPAPPAKSKTLPYAHVIWEPLRGCPIARSDAFVTASTYAKVKRLESAAGAARGHINSKVLGGVTDCIIVPLTDFKTGRFCGVELIAPNGKKATYGNKGVLMLGNDLDQSLPIHVCEGWADAAAILFHNNGNILVYAVFSKSRLDPIAQDIDEKYQGKRSVIIEREDGSK